MRGILAYYSVKTRGSPCLRSQSEAFHEVKDRRRKGLLRSLVYSLFWVRRPRANTQACEVKDLVIEKGKKPSHKKRKRKQVYSQNIETDVRTLEDTNPPDEEHLRKFTKRMCNLKNTPVILPLFKKLYGTPEEDTITEEPGQSNHNQPQTGIMSAKLLEILSSDPKTSTEEIVKLLFFSDTEQKHQAMAM